jgi:hypothetical protein
MDVQAWRIDAEIGALSCRVSSRDFDLSVAVVTTTNSLAELPAPKWLRDTVTD